MRFCLSILIASLFVFTADATENTKWQAGVARVNITPSHFMWMSGYGGRTVPADGKLTDVWAKALVLRDPNGREAVLITADLIGIGAESTQVIATALQKNHGLDRDQFAIATSHTHTGPALSDNLVPLHYLRAPAAEAARIAQYTIQMRTMIVNVVAAAYKTMQPVSLTWGNGNCTVAVNRRNNTEANVPQLRLAGELKGPFDHDVPVLAIRDAEFKLKTVVFGYACHSTVLSFTQWSGDYPGFAQAALEETNPGVTAMFWAGCGADQNPLPRRTVELAKTYGNRLATAVNSVLQGRMQKVTGPLQTQYREIQGRTVAPQTRKELEAIQRDGNQYEKPYAQYLLNQLDNNNVLPQTYAYPIQTWHLGHSVQWVFLGGEVVIDYAIKIKQGPQPTSPYRDPAIWVAGYSNDVMAYIPSLRVLREGGYEGGGSNIYYGFPALWHEEFESQILTEVRKQMGDTTTR
jgi:hypothetical protein